MSDQVVRLVPMDPLFKPAEAAATTAEQFVRELVSGSDEVSSTYFTSVKFVDAGENWSGVVCPKCRSEIDDWWPEAMSNAARTNFENLDADTPCCGTRVSLNELDYGWPVAFGSYVLEVTNPEIPSFEREQVEAVGELLGCGITQVVAHI